MSGLKEQLRKALAENDRLIRKMLFNTLEQMGVDPTSDVGLFVIDNMRVKASPNVKSTDMYSKDAIFEWLAEFGPEEGDDNV